MCKTNLTIHQKNKIRFSFQPKEISKFKFRKIYPEAEYEYLNIKSFDDDPSFHYTMLSLYDLSLLKFRNNEFYDFLVKKLYINLFHNSTHRNILCPVKYVVTTFNPAECVDYYQIKIKNKKNLVNIQLDNKVIDKNGNPKSILDVVNRFGKRLILGMNDRNEITEFEVQKVTLQNSQNDLIDSLDASFYEIGISNTNINKTISVDEILVNLD
jgi:hypothetical protein